MSMSTSLAPGAAASTPAPAPAAAPSAAPEPSAVDALRQAAQAKAARRPGRAQTPPPQGEPTPAPASPGEPASAAESTTDGVDTDVREDIEAIKAKAARSLHAARAHERRFRESEARAKKLEEQFAALTGDDLEAKIALAQKHGLGLREWTEHVIARRGEGGAPAADKPEGNSEIEALRREIEQLKSGEQKRSADSLRQQEMGVIERACESNEQWSIIRDLGRQDAVYERFYELQSRQGYAPRLSDVLDEVADKIAGGAKQLLRHDAVRKLAKADPELFSELRSYFAAEAAADDSAEADSEAKAPPKRRGALTQERVTPSSKTTQPRSYAERKRAAVSRLQAMRR